MGLLNEDAFLWMGSGLRACNRISLRLFTKDFTVTTLCLRTVRALIIFSRDLMPAKVPCSHCSNLMLQVVLVAQPEASILASQEVIEGQVITDYLAFHVLSRECRRGTTIFSGQDMD